MTGLALALVLTSAFIHASWNFLLKKSGGGTGLITAASLLSLAVYAPIVAIAWSSSVDLPMPGSPPTRMAEAGTRPPPSTRSNSSKPLLARGGWASVVARSVSGIDLPLAPSDFGPWLSGASSTMEFQAPHASHLPIHLRWAAPQAVQVN